MTLHLLITCTKCKELNPLADDITKKGHLYTTCKACGHQVFYKLVEMGDIEL